MVKIDSREPITPPHSAHRIVNARVRLHDHGAWLESNRRRLGRHCGPVGPCRVHRASLGLGLDLFARRHGYAFECPAHPGNVPAADLRLSGLHCLVRGFTRGPRMSRRSTCDDHAFQSFLRERSRPQPHCRERRSLRKCERVPYIAEGESWQESHELSFA